MFDSPYDAAAFLQSYFDVLPPPAIERLVDAVEPLIGAVALNSSARRMGETRLGGTPDLPKGAIWPRAAAPADPEEVAARANKSAAQELRDHFAAHLPYAFLGQIDLGERPALDGQARGLPDEGRLLFFYDIASGPWDNGTRVAHVIFDRSATETLETLSPPADLLHAHEAEKAAFQQTARKYGFAFNPVSGSRYMLPAQPLTLETRYAIPARFSVEWREAGLETVFEPLLRNDPDWDISSALEEIEEEGRPYDAGPLASFRMLGGLAPEQDDPRRDAAEIGGGEAKEWTLLLQISVEDLAREPSEGTIYFLIRDENLKRGVFDGVVGVYQQT